MTVWQQAPMSPHPVMDHPVYPWHGDLVETPQQLPPTPLSDRRDTGLVPSLEMSTPHLSPTPSNGSRGNLNEENQDMNIGRSVSLSPPRSLLSRLLDASQEEGE